MAHLTVFGKARLFCTRFEYGFATDAFCRRLSDRFFIRRRLVQTGSDWFRLADISLLPIRANPHQSLTAPGGLELLPLPAWLISDCISFPLGSCQPASRSLTSPYRALRPLHIPAPEHSLVQQVLSFVVWLLYAWLRPQKAAA